MTSSYNNDDEASIQELAEELRKKLQLAHFWPNLTINSASCKELGINMSHGEPWDDSCDASTRTCPRTSLPDDLSERIRSLVSPPSAHVPNKYLSVLEDMRNNVTLHPDTNFLILSAVSSNHFLESQDMLRNFHVMVYPFFKNFSLIVYDIGLMPEERRLLEKHCRCHVADFPFQRLPDWHRDLRCFSWKIFIIAAHYLQAEVTMWSDASIRITRPVNLIELIKQTKLRGVQQRNVALETAVSNPLHTLPEMFQHFGDSPCAHMTFRQCEAGFGVYHREKLVHRAVILPWLACAVRRDCLCQEGWTTNEFMRCRPLPKNNIARCNRGDQSAISVILAKLFRQKYHYFAADTYNAQKVRKNKRREYFLELESREMESKVDSMYSGVFSGGASSQATGG